MAQASPFVGREHELQELRALEHKKTASLLVMHGRRRVGKSRLSYEFGSRHLFISLSGLPPTEQTTPASQRRDIVTQVASQLSIQPIVAQDWAARLIT